MRRKRAIVTGASRGVGKGIACCLAEDGYELVISYFDGGKESYAADTCETIRNKYGVNCTAIPSDFEKKDAPKAFIHEALDILGGVDVLVNNGCNPIHGGSILDVQEDALDGMLQSFLRSNVIISREAARDMLKRQIKGNIINITSGRAVTVLPNAGLYGGMKAAITQFSRSFALDLAPYGIRINCIAPGYIKVREIEEMREQGLSEKQINFRLALEKRVPLGGEAGKPSDIGNAVVWLASDKARYVTGSVVTVDGGFFLPGQREEMEEEGTEDMGWTFFKRKDGSEWDA